MQAKSDVQNGRGFETVLQVFWHAWVKLEKTGIRQVQFWKNVFGFSDQKNG